MDSGDHQRQRPDGGRSTAKRPRRRRIDQPVAAALARLLITVFGRFADRKLAEGFAVTARVAEWAFEQPREFCQWVAHEPLPAFRRERILAVVPGCAARAAPLKRRRRTDGRATPPRGGGESGRSNRGPSPPAP